MTDEQKIRELKRLNFLEDIAWEGWQETKDMSWLHYLFRVVDERCRLVGYHPPTIAQDEKLDKIQKTLDKIWDRMKYGV